MKMVVTFQESNQNFEATFRENNADFEFACESAIVIGGGTSFKTDDTLTLEDGILSVNTTDLVEKDNTLPITSAGVYETVGNIEVLLKTI